MGLFISDTSNSDEYETTPGPEKTVSTPENIERIRQVILRSPSHSARRLATELRKYKNLGLYLILFH